MMNNTQIMIDGINQIQPLWSFVAPDYIPLNNPRGEHLPIEELKSVNLGIVAHMKSLMAYNDYPDEAILGLCEEFGV
jgi:hypothetical protein